MPNGIHYAHAYSILGTHTITYKGEKVRLVHLRNPWAEESYTGAWNDFDPRWKKVNVSGMKISKTKKDGRFWMPIEDFR